MGKSGNPAKAAAEEEAKNRPLTFDHLRSIRKPTTRILTLCLDSELKDAAEAAQADYDRMVRDHRSQRVTAARMSAEQQARLETELEPELLAKTEALEEARAAAAEATVNLRLVSIGRKAFEDLWNDHPPTEEQIKEHQANTGDDSLPPYNPETFAPALFVAVIQEPKLTLEQAQEIYDEWNSADTTAIFLACMDVCNRSQIDMLGKGSGRTTV